MAAAEPPTKVLMSAIVLRDIPVCLRVLPGSAFAEQLLTCPRFQSMCGELSEHFQFPLPHVISLPWQLFGEEHTSTQMLATSGGAAFAPPPPASWLGILRSGLVFFALPPLTERAFPAIQHFWLGLGNATGLTVLF